MSILSLICFQMVTFLLQEKEYFLKKCREFLWKILRLPKSCDMMDIVQTSKNHKQRSACRYPSRPEAEL